MKILNWAVLTGCLFLLASPAEARTWTSRDGTHTVEAELVDFQDGKVVLRREDGSLIRVALSDLSLGDVHYVHEALEAAGRELGEGPSAKASTRRSSRPTVHKGEPPLTRPGSGKWRAAVDPPALPLELPSSAEISLRIPLEHGKPLILYPSTPSPFVVLGHGRYGGRPQVWDLRTGEMAGEIRGEPGMPDHVAASPDGKHLAIFSLGTMRTVRIWSFETGKAVHELELGERFASVSWLDFAGPNRLIAAVSAEQACLVWDVHTGEQITKIDAYPTPRREQIAISPGGAYLAMNVKLNSLQIMDTRNGEEAGNIVLEPSGGRGMLRADGLAFSPDGKELAGWFTEGGGAALLVWNAANGRLAVEHRFPENPLTGLMLTTYQGRPLEWFADRSAWLVRGGAVFDRESGGPLWVEPRDPQRIYRAPRRFVDAERMLDVIGNRESQTLRLVPIPKEKIAASGEVVRAGGTTADVGLPPITVAELLKAKKVVLRGRVGDWHYRPREFGLPPGIVDKGPLALEEKCAEVRQIVFSRPGDAAKMLVGSYSQEKARSSPESISMQVHACRVYDLESGEQTARFEVPFATELKDFSPEGELGLFCAGQAKERLDVFHLADGRHVAGFRPYHQLDRSWRRIRWAALVDENHLLTTNIPGTLVLWSLPECKAVYSMALGVAASTFLSPDRGTLVASIGEHVYLLDPSEGKTLGMLPAVASTAPKAMTRAAFREDGARLAGLYYEDDTLLLAIWDLSSGTLLSQLMLPFQGFGVTWCGPEHVLIHHTGRSDSLNEFNQCSLVDVERNVVLWTYQLPSGKHAAAVPDGRHWFVSGATPLGVAQLSALSLPDREASRLLTEAEIPEPLVGPGQGVALRVEVLEAPQSKAARREGFSDLEPRLTRAFTQRLADQGIRVDGLGRATVRITLKELTEEATIGYRSLLFRRGMIVLATKDVYAEVAIVAPDDRVIWVESESVREARGDGLENRPPEMALSDFIRLQKWKQAVAWLSQVNVPVPIYEPEVYRGLGESTLSPSGAKTIRVPSKPGRKPPKVLPPGQRMTGTGESPTPHGSPAAAYRCTRPEAWPATNASTSSSAV